ncbi:putative kinesin heavy chain [Fasciolopsis buskii]|uniref:Putative kinesin heavy chain n=1 Tax=Fasciolopsis buskii TaxID=27845 RepID=A0A8E0RY76_9TREM|nr:putative kinesin heavy chain [Fasciolopsis buski]
MNVTYNFLKYFHVKVNKTILPLLFFNSNLYSKTAENEVHRLSSRSHVICTIYYHEVSAQSVRSDANYSREFRSKLSLIDLAGSERAHRALNYQRFDEGRNINLSLSSLSTVISKLGKSESIRGSQLVIFVTELRRLMEIETND